MRIKKAEPTAARPDRCSQLELQGAHKGGKSLQCFFLIQAIESDVEYITFHGRDGSEDVHDGFEITTFLLTIGHADITMIVISFLDQFGS